VMLFDHESFNRETDCELERRLCLGSVRTEAKNVLTNQPKYVDFAF
jgi:hypothetical protein